MYVKISLVRTPFPLNFLCGNAVPMRSRPSTPLTLYNHRHVGNPQQGNPSVES